MGCLVGKPVRTREATHEDRKVDVRTARIREANEVSQGVGLSRGNRIETSGKRTDRSAAKGKDFRVTLTVL